MQIIEYLCCMKKGNISLVLQEEMYYISYSLLSLVRQEGNHFLLSGKKEITFYCLARGKSLSTVWQEGNHFLLLSLATNSWYDLLLLRSPAISVGFTILGDIVVYVTIR